MLSAIDPTEPTAFADRPVAEVNFISTKLRYFYHNFVECKASEQDCKVVGGSRVAMTRDPPEPPYG